MKKSHAAASRWSSPQAMKNSLSIVLCGSMMLAAATPVFAQPDYDFDWATIGSPWNSGYDGPDLYGDVTGRGRVDYAYRISKLEVTTAQWMEFVNTFTTQSDELGGFAWPIFWGATLDPDYSGPGNRWKLDGRPNAATPP